MRTECFVTVVAPEAQLSRAARERDAAGGSWAALPPEGSASEV